MSFLLLHRGKEWIAFLGLATVLGAVQAAGLGPAQVQSALGEPLRVSIALLGGDAYDARCIEAKARSLDGSASFTPAVRLNASGDAILLTTGKALNEPVLQLSIESVCGTPIRREYQVLFDPATMPSPPPMFALDRELSPAALQAATQPRTPAATARAERRKQQKQHDTELTASGSSSSSRGAAAPRNVLKISSSEQPVVTRLHLVEELPEDTAETAEAADDAAAGKTAEMLTLLKALHEETQALRTETERLKQQYASDKSRMEAMHEESLQWVRILLASLAGCVVVAGLLLWRLHRLKKNATHVAWNDIFSDTSSTTQLGSASEFGTTTFQITALDTGELKTGTNPLDPTMSPPEETAGKTAADATPRTYRSEATLPYVHTNRTETAAEAASKEQEIAGVMELAEIWMTMHDPASVAGLLEPFARVEQPQSPLPMLCLLDVYRALNDRNKYDAIRKRIKRIFNVKVSSWDQANGDAPIRTLADYPHVRERILELWDHPELPAYLDSLVLDKRNGLREGFDLPAYRDILRLKTLATDKSQSGKALPPQAYAILFSAEGNAEETAHDTKASPAKDSLLPPDFPPVAVASKPSAINGPQETVLEWEPPVSVATVPEPDPFDAHEDMSPMAIKLHLAEAYCDIGDREGALLLLEEVIQEGNAEQADRARHMLKALTV